MIKLSERDSANLTKTGLNRCNDRRFYCYPIFNNPSSFTYTFPFIKIHEKKREGKVRMSKKIDEIAYISQCMKEKRRYIP